ncbi:MAG TPA: hypothetical protein GXZ36_10095 [Firmicutes bacterium]|jgi:large subunit ribosomal protein L14e|nr:hypothetical protein [Bacillota bacterium]
MVKMTVAGLRLGQLVTSIQGRDCGQNYIIIGFIGDYYLLVADGVRHKLDKAKKKNLKHVKVSLQVDRTIEAKLTAGQRVTDEEIHCALQNLEKRPEEGEVKY